MNRTHASAWRYRYLAEACGAASGITLGFLFVFLSSPAHFLSKLCIVSGPNCGKSEKLVSSILGDATLQRTFTPLSVSDDLADPTVASVCGVAYQHVLENAPWFRVAGQDWVCARLRETAIRYRDDAHAVLPVWVHEGAIIDVERRDELLVGAGYYLLPNGEGVVLANSPDAVQPPPATPSGALSEWRGQSIGF